jgi:hypothetical protein
VRFIALALALLAGVAACGDDSTRQDEVAARGAEVMPFDLDQTTHVFTPTADGGTQTVVADDPENEEQVGLVRAHLREEAERFQRGDFSDPAAIHGQDMPGIAALESGYEDVSVRVADVDGGARITYRTDHAALVEALHVWFDAQVSDHGRHAEMHG